MRVHAVSPVFLVPTVFRGQWAYRVPLAWTDLQGRGVLRVRWACKGPRERLER